MGAGKPSTHHVEHLPGGEAGNGMSPGRSELSERPEEEFALREMRMRDMKRPGVIKWSFGGHYVDVDLSVVVGAIPSAVAARGDGLLYGLKPGEYLLRT